MNNRSAFLRQAVIATLAFAAAPTFAQQTAQDNEEAAARLKRIIVTAQKREQSLQDVPIVVTAVSEQLLQDTGVKDIKDLTVLTPGLTVTSTSSEASTTARIRGVGTVGDNPGLESSVGVVIDGVYRPRNGVGFGDLGELERIEVLKGPQGTLFGKNTSAGVINIITKQAVVRLRLATSKSQQATSAHLEGSASITGPIARRRVAARLYVGARERDGFLDVARGAGPRHGTDDNDRNVETARGQLLLEPSEAFEHSHRRRLQPSATRSCCGGAQVVAVQLLQRVRCACWRSRCESAGDAFDSRCLPNRRNAARDRRPGWFSRSELRLSGAATLTSVTRMAQLGKRSTAQDVDYSTADIWLSRTERHHAAELRHS